MAVRFVDVRSTSTAAMNERPNTSRRRVQTRLVFGLSFIAASRRRRL